MRKVLILGVQGMLGNAIYKYLSKQSSIKVIGTSRHKATGFSTLSINSGYQNSLNQLITKIQPQYVINCIALIKAAPSATNQYLLVNSVFPQVLSSICSKQKARLIHFSTNGVFSGKKGSYTETDLPDDTSIYGISKYLGEIRQPPHLTVRTSLIGCDFAQKKSLLNWFLDAKESVTGFSRVYWNGVSTLTIAKIIYRIISKDMQFPKTLIHIAGEKVNKYQLLNIFKKVYNKHIGIMKDKDTFLDQTLVASIEQKQFNDLILPIKNQIGELKQFYA